MKAKTGQRRKTLQRLFSLLKPHSFKYFASLIGLAVLLTSERMFVAYIIKLFVDSIMTQNMDLLWYAVRSWFLFMVFFLPAGVALFYVWRSTIYQMIADLRQMIFSHLQRLPLGYLEQRHSGDLISVMTNDVTTAQKAFEEDMLNLVNASLQGISAAIFMFVLDWRLALIVIGSGFIPLVVNTSFAGPLRKAGEIVQARMGGVSERLADLLAGYQVVRAYNLGEWILARFDRANRDLLEENAQVRLEASAAANGLAVLSIFLPFGIGSYMVRTETTFGVLVALIQLNNQIQFFVYSMGGTMRIQTALAC
jgi:ATP-binding cassette subfamily B protein